MEVPPSLVPAELVPDTRALSAAEELKSFQVAPGYRVELAASEPLVGDPIFAQFGPDGRLWVVEMRGYMPDIHGNREDEPVGRIVILTDTDGDGRFDQSKVFLDQLIMPRTVLPVGDGALVGAPPMLWYCPDKNGDGKADEKIVVAQDAGAQTIPGRPELANPEHGANSPLWGLDNWIYFAEYAARFRWRGAGVLLWIGPIAARPAAAGRQPLPAADRHLSARRHSCRRRGDPLLVPDRPPVHRGL